jgi:very-short-patch-repair endonuclease
MDPKIKRARRLRQGQTEAENALWSILRAGRTCGLKFRRQHPIGPFYADFACVKHMLIVELDGEYHDQVVEADLERQAFLENLGWKVLRFTNEDVKRDVEAVGIAIAKYLGLKFEFQRPGGMKSGMFYGERKFGGEAPSKPR